MGGDWAVLRELLLPDRKRRGRSSVRMEVERYRERMYLARTEQLLCRPGNRSFGDMRLDQGVASRYTLLFVALTTWNHVLDIIMRLQLFVDESFISLRTFLRASYHSITLHYSNK